jgi:hypothetical protein
MENRAAHLATAGVQLTETIADESICRRMLCCCVTLYRTTVPSKDGGDDTGGQQRRWAVHGDRTAAEFGL